MQTAASVKPGGAIVRSQPLSQQENRHFAALLRATDPSKFPRSGRTTWPTYGKTCGSPQFTSVQIRPTFGAVMTGTGDATVWRVRHRHCAAAHRGHRPATGNAPRCSAAIVGTVLIPALAETHLHARAPVAHRTNATARCQCGRHHPTGRLGCPAGRKHRRLSASTPEPAPTELGTRVIDHHRRGSS